MPAVAHCGGVTAKHVLIRQLGCCGLFLSEVRVFGRAPPPAAPLPPPPAHAVAAAINRRYEEARPSSVLAEGGVLLHIYDGYGSERAPWQFCTDDCERGPIDTLSSSLISRRLPWIFEAEARWGAVGFILAPDVEVLCAFYHDAGSGGHPNGKCPWPPNSGPHTELPHTGRPLGEVMVEHFDACAGGETGERYHGTGHFMRNGHCGSGYNEVMTSWTFWESNLPWAIEAFVYATDGGPDGHFERNRERARGIHRAFLANFGLAPREVPLLFYRCGPGGPDGGQPFTEATAPEGGCFEEDEGD